MILMPKFEDMFDQPNAASAPEVEDDAVYYLLVDSQVRCGSALPPQVAFDAKTLLVGFASLRIRSRSNATSQGFTHYY